MAITVKVGEEAVKDEEQQETQPESKVQQKPDGRLGVKLKIRRTLDGNYYIYDHHYIDIVLMPEKMKIVTFPYSEKQKIAHSDLVYATQDKFFDFLSRRGIIAPESIKGGNVFGSMEGTILKPKDSGLPVDQIVLLNISTWIDEQRPALEFDKKYDEEFDKRMTDPTDEESTELGEVPQETQKGSIPKYQSRRYLGGWWWFMQEEKTEETVKEEPVQEEQKLNRKQRRAIKSKRGGDSQDSQGANKSHTNRISEKPKARRRWIY